MFRSLRRAFTRNASERQEKVPSPVDIEGEGEFQHRLNEIQLLNGHRDIVRVLLRIDAHRVASASDDKSIIVWDVSAGKRLYTLEGHTLPVTCLLLIPNAPAQGGPLIVSGSSDKTTRIWSADEGVPMHEPLKAHTGSVKCLVSLDNDKFCSGGNDSQLIVWNKDGKMVGIIPRPESDYLHAVLVVRNNRLVAASESSLLVYDTSSLKFHKSLSSSTERAHREAVRCLVNVPDGLFASGSLDGEIKLWSTLTMNCVRSLNYQSSYQDPEHHMYIYSVQHMVAVGDRFLLAAIGCGFSLYDVLTGECLLTCAKAHRSTVQHIIVLYNGERILTCSADSSIRIWGPESLLASSTQYDVNRRRLSLTAIATPPPTPGKVAGVDVFFPSRARGGPISTPASPSLNDKTLSGYPSPLPMSFTGSSFMMLGGAVAAPYSLTSTSTASAMGGFVSPIAASTAVGSAPPSPIKEGSAFGTSTGLSALNIAGGGNAGHAAHPVCLGELVAHTDAVNSLLAVNECAFVSCGSDNLVAVWKDGLVEAYKRNELAQALLSRYLINQSGDDEY